MVPKKVRNSKEFRDTGSLFQLAEDRTDQKESTKKESNRKKKRFLKNPKDPNPPQVKGNIETDSKQCPKWNVRWSLCCLVVVCVWAQTKLENRKPDKNEIL